MLFLCDREKISFIVCVCEREREREREEEDATRCMVQGMGYRGSMA
jgi:hypothetical protein